ADSALEGHDDAIEIRFGEDHDAGADDRENREPAERQLQRPHRHVWWTWLLLSGVEREGAQRTRFAGHRSALIDHPAADGERVSVDLRAWMQPKVAVDDDRGAVDRSEDVQGAIDDPDGLTDDGAGRNHPIADREVF